MLVTTCWLVAAYANFILHVQYSRGELCWRDFMKYTFNIVMCQDICEPICFKQFDSCLNDLDVNSRAQGYGKSGTCAVILL